MSLTAALGIAQNALIATARRTSIVSQNVTNADNPNYSRRTAILASEAPGVRVAEIRRATSEALLRQNLNAFSSWQAQSQMLSGLDTIALSVNGADNASSAATALGKLQEALQLYSATPSSANLAEGAVDAARQVVESLNRGSEQLQSIRTSMDAEIGIAVDDINRLLADFETANKAVIAASSTGRDTSDALDQRDAIVRELSAYIPVSASTGANQDMTLTTANGVTLFETRPRAVTFAPSGAFGPGVAGNDVYIDGVPLKPQSGSQAGMSGGLSGLIALRDDVTVTMQSQLDEVARGVIEAFSEVDRSGGGGPALAGLFTWSGGPALPASGSVTVGLSAMIRVNPAFDSDAGGNPVLLRDGGANGADYVANTAGGASYADLLIEYGGRLDAPTTFDASAGLATGGSVMEFSATSIGWLEALRQDSSERELSTSALMTRTGEALSNEVGVNVDIEMSLLLDLEHAYEASARIIRAVDEMMATLMEAV